jgi:pimeloyl-ACP methyl ester carboxylesterase
MFRQQFMHHLVETDDGRDRWADAEVAAQVMYPRLEPATASRLAARLRWQADPGPYPYDRLPDVPSTYIYALDDELFTTEGRRWCAEHIYGLEPVAIAGGHFPMLERPASLASLLIDLVEEGQT